MAVLPILTAILGCTAFVDGATRQVFVEAALDLDRVPEGEARERVLAMTDAGWLRASEVGIDSATRFATALDRMLVDDELSDDEVARLAEIAQSYRADRLAGHDSELLAKRQAEAELRQIRTARLGVRLEGVGVWPAPGPLAERGEAVGWTPLSCHRANESGYQTETCRFSDGDEVVRLTYTVYAERGDARLAARPAPWERGAVALQKGKRVLKVRATDREEAERVVTELAAALAPPDDEAEEAPSFPAALTSLGLRVDACRTERTDVGQRSYCDIRAEDRGGFAVLEERSAEVVAEASPTYASSEARLELGALGLRARVYTAAASGEQLRRFRGLGETEGPDR